MSDLQNVRSILQAARKVLVITGAGISAESGIPTFRGEGGYWHGHRAEDLATPEGFKKNPRLVWDWYCERRALILQAQPNAAHVALAEWSKSRQGVSLLTQNVDDLHERAGQPDTVLLHGSIWKNRCRDCGFEHLAKELEYKELPHCPNCKEMIGPGVIWFGETLGAQRVNDMMRSAVSSDIVLIIGTSGVVQPVASVARLARLAKKIVIIVDPKKTQTPSDIHCVGNAGDVLPQILHIQ